MRKTKISPAAEKFMFLGSIVCLLSDTKNEFFKVFTVWHTGLKIEMKHLNMKL